MPEKDTTEDKFIKRSARGFASMPKEKVIQAAIKGGKIRAEHAGHEGMSAIGKKGGEARKLELGTIGYSKMGRKGGKVSHKGRKKAVVNNALNIFNHSKTYKNANNIKETNESIKT